MTATRPTPPDAAVAGVPLLRIHGDATPEEIAAVVVAITAVTSPGPWRDRPQTLSVWAARRRALGGAAAGRGADSWRTSSWPA